MSEENHDQQHEIQVNVPLEKWVENICEETVRRMMDKCPMAKLGEGNGRPGLGERINRLEAKSNIIFWMGGIIVVQSVALVFWLVRSTLT